MNDNNMENKKNEEKRRAAEAARLLAIKYPDAECSLDAGRDAWRLLIMARLSAQCTDARVNEVSRALFDRFPTPKAMADGDIAEIESLIRSCGLYHMKARDIKNASAIIAGRFGGKVPDNMEALLSLPGVGRKIANLILGDVYKKGGIVADTHCIRICGRLGFCDGTKKDPLLTERVMSELIPISEQSAFCHRLVLFGRETCTARSPKCDTCELCMLCAHNLQNNP